LAVIFSERKSQSILWNYDR